MEVSRHAATETPTLIGEYTILATVARGGMATVLVGRRDGVAGFERIVAIKCCHPHLRSNDAFRKMFLEEARLAAKIHHPNVAATLDVSDDDPLYLVMEYVDGESLAVLQRVALATQSRIPVDITLRIMTDSLSGLHAAHESKSVDGVPLGLVHCDVSPQNILVGLDGVTRIVDFGIARAAASVTPDDDVIKGKLAYMAPEQFLSQQVTPQTDVFGAGVVLWEMLTLRRLFQRDNDPDTAVAAMAGTIDPPSTFAPEVPAALDAVVLRALQRNRNERFRTAADFLTALEKVPIPPATARKTAEYMRDVVVDEKVASRRTRINRSQAEIRTMTGVRTNPPHSVAVDEIVATRIVEPPKVLVDQTRRSRSSMSPPSDSIRPGGSRRSVRGVIVAVTLVLLGCGIGLLFAASHNDTKPRTQSGSANTPSAVHS